ncbi:hypothetical protein LUZ61_005389 [Rhynchospora tenuis]|nr:hypothetical protein LUZ61_005389 [Rhynchospora tenuis]
MAVKILLCLLYLSCWGRKLLCNLCSQYLNELQGIFHVILADTTAVMRANNVESDSSFISLNLKFDNFLSDRNRFSMAETVVLKVGMTCEGCVGAVKRVLGKMQGVESFDVDLKEQKVTVKGNVTPDDVLKTVSKTGKKTTFWEEGETAASA